VATPPVPVKTPDGQAELNNRQRGLSQRHRTVLLLVDGRRNEEQVRALARKAGAPDNCFGELLDMGLIVLPVATIPLQPPPAAGRGGLQVDIPLDEVDSLPPVRTLAPDSVLDSKLALTDSKLQDLDAIADASDPAMEEARGILMRAVRAEAPVAGSLTVLKLRRAATRAELLGLLEEVESRITKPYRSLTAQQTLRRVRQLLLLPRIDSRLPAA
jgi:hypothetical protein